MAPPKFAAARPGDRLGGEIDVAAMIASEAATPGGEPRVREPGGRRLASRERGERPRGAAGGTDRRAPMTGSLVDADSTTPRRRCRGGTPWARRAAASAARAEEHPRGGRGSPGWPHSRMVTPRLEAVGDAGEGVERERADSVGTPVRAGRAAAPPRPARHPAPDTSPSGTSSRPDSPLRAGNGCAPRVERAGPGRRRRRRRAFSLLGPGPVQPVGGAASARTSGAVSPN